MLLIYVQKLNPRIEYITQLIFSEILHIDYEFSTNSREFQQSDWPKFNYSTEKFKDEFYIKPHRLMFSRAILQPVLEPVWYEGNKYFCESSKDSDLPFDPLAASFYVVTRHEEYTEQQKDKLDRYPAQRSILVKHQLLQKPVVNIWAKLLGDKLQQRYPSIEITKNKFQFISSIDIDNAWAYLHKGFWRSGINLFRSLLKNREEFGERLRVLSGKQNDPYDSYSYLDKIFSGNEDKALFFILLGDYARYDKNISHRNKHYQKLIRDIRQKYEVGIHPSFASSRAENGHKVETERLRLQNIVGNDIRKSRQHFLRLTLPHSYRRLITCGIQEDYTMGYSCLPGFRAGICTPYYFYDLEQESTTNLRIVPFQIMDGTFTHYLHLSPDKAWQEIQKIMLEVKNIGGTFVSIWHNETVTDKGIWKGYREVFETMNKTGFQWANEEAGT